MKSKRIGVSVLTLILGLICGLGFVSMPKQKVEASAAEEPTYYTQYMLEDGVPVKKEYLDTSAGKMYVNGQLITNQDDLSFVLTEENIELKAEANIGFELKGWYITFKDKADVVLGTTNGYISTSNLDQEICDGNIVVKQYTDLNKSADLAIKQMQESLIIAPVFDYQYYTVTYKGVNTTETVGQFKFGDEVVISKDISNNVNVDATSLVSAQISLAIDADGTIANSEYKFTKDANLRTTKVEAKFTMSVYQDVAIELRYDRLYRVDFELYLEETKLTSGTEYNEILSCVNIAEVKAFSKIDGTDLSYFVKNGEDFKVECASNYKNGGGYVYYEFASLDGSTGRNLGLNNISTNRTIQIKYTHKEFNVSFVGVEYNSTDKTVIVNNDLLVEDSKQLIRVDGSNAVELNDTILKENVGYNHLGFVKSVNGKSQYDLATDRIADYELSSTEPKDAVIYVLYQKKEYSLNLTGLTNVHLTDTKVSPNVTYYPIKSINGVEINYEEVDNGKWIVKGVDGNAVNCKIGDVITFELRLNYGFNVTAISGMTKQEDAQIYMLTLDKVFLTGKGTTVDLAVSAQALKYTLTYKIKEDISLNTMADINVDVLGVDVAWKTANILKEDRVNDAENFVDDGYYHIKVTNLTRYQVVVLTSKANTTGNANEYYVYRYFTYDFNTSIDGVTGDELTPETQTLTIAINDDVTVFVVYSQPKTQLQIVVDSAPADLGISFEVKQQPVVDALTPIDGFYTVQKGENSINISINGLTNNEKLYGYRFIDITLYTQNGLTKTEVTNSSSINTSEYTFVPNVAGTYDTFVVVVKIEKIIYEFNLSSSLAGFNIEGTPSKNLSLQLTVDNPVLEFEKVEGYYVNHVQIKNGENWVDLSTIAQNNNSRSGLIVNGRDLFSTYYYNLENFKDLTAEYGVVSGNNIKVELMMSFVRYGYDVEIKYVKFFNNELNESNVSLVYPTIKLGYKFTNEANEEPIYANYESLASGIRFKEIPYGANITLEVVRGVSVGFKMMGWYDYDARYQKTGDFIYGENENLIKYFQEENKEDFKLAYRVDFEEYTIKLMKSISDAGTPMVNGKETETIKMGDSFRIEPNASLANGFLFNQFKYKVNKFVPYNFVDDVTFATDWDKLYIKDNNGYVYKNISSLRNENYEYFTLESKDEVADVVVYEDRLNIANYFVEVNEITFELVYVPVEMMLENISFAATKTNPVTGEELCYPETTKKIVLDLASVGLDVDDIASYQVYANNGSTEREIVENSEDHKITINDTIRVVVQINKAANGNKVYDLTKGLELNSSALKNGWRNLSCQDLGDGKYEISFRVVDNIRVEFAQNGKITLNYGYLLKETKQVTATTNMAGSSNFVNNTLLSINGIRESTSQKADGFIGSISQSNPFLQNVNVSLDLQTLKSHFVIHSVTIYKDTTQNGEKLENNIIDKSDFERYWIVPNETTLEGTDRFVISSVDLTTLDFGVIVQFNLQPRIKVEGEEITTQLEKRISRTYRFEVENGEIHGLAQEIELGTSKGIEGYGMEYLTTELWQKGVKINSAIDVGEYDVKLVFKDGVTQEQKINCWKYYIDELPCVIRLRISPIVISVTYEKPTVFEREYNASNGYDLGLIKDGTKLKSQDGNIVISGKYGNDLPFDMGLLDIVGGKAEIVSGNVVEGLKTQKNVTGNYVNIFITDLTLKNNKNFELRFEEYDYFVTLTDTEKRSGVLVENVVKIIPKAINIENIEVYDKVYNEDAAAQFGLAPGHNKYIIKFVYTEDDVYLLADEVKAYFTNSPITSNGNLVDLLDNSVGADKNIVIDARTALAGRDKANYVIGDLGNGLLNYKDLKTIYPYQITSVVKGVGNVTLTNERGKTDCTKANLLPVGSKVALVVERIEPNSVGYREIEEKISSYLSRRNTFAAGYKLTLLDNNGMEVKISNELKLTIPNEEDLKNIVSLAGDRSKNIEFTFDASGNIVIDLSQIEEDISTFCLIQNRALLKAWQIVLIVVLSLVAAAGIGVAVFFIVRRRRKKNEKYDVI